MRTPLMPPSIPLAKSSTCRVDDVGRIVAGDHVEDQGTILRIRFEKQLSLPAFEEDRRGARRIENN